VVGQTLLLVAPPVGSPVLSDGTQIASLGTGTGGAGTYNLDTNVGTTPVPSQAMLAIPVPALDNVAVGIAHVPVLSPANVNVVLQ
jgi:hypothetical protein